MQRAGGLITSRRVQRRSRISDFAGAPASTSGSGFAWVSRDDQWWLDAFGFTQLDYLLNLSAAVAALPAANQTALRLPHPMAKSDGHTLILKRENYVRWRDRLANARADRCAWSCARREFECIRRLTNLGIGCPRPLVCLEDGFYAGRACLLLDDLAGGTPLHVFLSRQWPNIPSLDREAFFGALGRSVALLHQKGLLHGQLYAPNMVVRREREGWHFAFRNLAQGRTKTSLALRDRVGELALLLATLADRLVSSHERQCLLDSYMAQCQLGGNASQLLQPLNRRIEQLLARRWVWEIRESDTAEHQRGRRATLAQQTSLWIDPDFRTELEHAGLASFEGMMATPGGKCLRALKDRENWRIEFEPSSKIAAAYLKKHRVRNWRSWLKASLGVGAGDTAGRVEARNIAELSRAGIAAMRLIAFGERLSAGGQLESFILTEELTGYRQLDQFIKQRFSPVRTGRSPGQVRDLRKLIHEIADLAAKFHQIGYNHRDLYCCHFFIREISAGQFKVNLIDLQRVEFRRFWRRRWIVKDLAQLAYSAPREYVTCSQRMAFIKRYLGVTKLGLAEKRLIRQVLAKQTLMEWQLGKSP